jgi:chemotaxis protein methyltransferase CheR
MPEKAGMMMSAAELDEVEMDLLLEGVARVYGYDFRGYARGSLKRRMQQWLGKFRFASFGAAQVELLRDPALFEELKRGITVNVSEMFRDPAVFRELREQVVPHLKTYPFVKIWHAGCSGGEEAYSMAILLEEEGLKGRFRIYATDLNDQLLHRGREGIFSLKEMELFESNYRDSGGRGSLSDYYFASYNHALLAPALRESIVFAPHNLAADGVFGEMQLVLCRNVLIYFGDRLKERALQLLDSSLAPGCFLCLGTKESLAGRPLSGNYQEIAPGSRIFRKGY